MLHFSRRLRSHNYPGVPPFRQITSSLDTQHQHIENQGSSRSYLLHHGNRLRLVDISPGLGVWPQVQTYKYPQELGAPTIVSNFVSRRLTNTSKTDALKAPTYGRIVLLWHCLELSTFESAYMSEHDTVIRSSVGRTDIQNSRGPSKCHRFTPHVRRLPVNSPPSSDTPRRGDPAAAAPAPFARRRSRGTSRRPRRSRPRTGPAPAARAAAARRRPRTSRA